MRSTIDAGLAAGRRRACPTCSRAGWSGGMLSASKLYQSVSTSGPSATVKPRPTKTSSRRLVAWVTRCRWPASAAGRTSVRSSRSASSCARRPPARAPARVPPAAALDGAARLVQRLAGRPALVGGRARRAALSAASVERLPSSSLSTAAQLVERVGLRRRARAQRPPPRRRRSRRSSVRHAHCPGGAGVANRSSASDGACAGGRPRSTGRPRPSPR